MTAQIPLLGLKLDAPRQYATYCKGHPMRVREVRDAGRDLTILWDADIISFAQDRRLVEYDLPAVLGLIVNTREKIMGWEICTLRIALSEPDGERGSLPIITSDLSLEAQFQQVIGAIETLHLPIPFFGSPEAFRHHMTDGS